MEIELAAVDMWCELAYRHLRVVGEDRYEALEDVEVEGQV